MGCYFSNWSQCKRIMENRMEKSKWEVKWKLLPGYRTYVQGGRFAAKSFLICYHVFGAGLRVFRDEQAFRV